MSITLEKFIRQSRSAVPVAPPHLRDEVLAYAKANPFRRFSLFAIRYAISLGVVLLFGASGTVFAAQQAQPGQPLYGLKRVSETAYVGVQPSANAKAQASELLIGRRIDEAEKAVEDDFSSEGDVASANIDDRISVDLRLASDLADESDEWISAQDQAFSWSIDRDR
jgi:hypothetical protein